MADDIRPFPIPFFGRGEQSAAAPSAWAAGEVARLENFRIAGPGALLQVPDWRLANTAGNSVGTPGTGGTESNAVTGIFPFAQPTNSLVGAGVQFSFNTADDKIYLHHLDESGAIIRTIAAYTSYTLATPPQITGFEWFGKFIFCAYGREAATARLGLAVYDPAAATVTHPTFDLVAGGNAATVLKFRGISKHYGLALGWGYQDEETGNIDRPAILRWCSYAAADLTQLASWQEDDSPVSAGKVVIGTPDLPIVACGPAGPYSVIGKEREVFILGGDYSSQLYTQPIGAHGPASTTGLASWGVGAAWMSHEGPARCVSGSPVELMGTNRLRRRLATYFDLTYTWATHYAAEQLIGFLLRRKQTLDGIALSAHWADEILWWDYARDEFMVQGTPTTCFSIGTIQGPGQTLAAPAGAPVSAAASSVGATSAQANWTNGDVSVDVVTYLDYKLTSASVWTTTPPIASGVASYLLTGLSPSSAYSYRLRHFKNGQFSAYSATQSFTTAAPSAVGSPVSPTASQSGPAVVKGVNQWTQTFRWTRGEFSSGSKTVLYEHTIDASAAATVVAGPFPASQVISSVTKPETAATFFYWVAHVLADGTEGDRIAVAGTPLSYEAP